MNGTDFEGINPLDKDKSARKMNSWVSGESFGAINGTNPSSSKSELKS